MHIPDPAPPLGMVRARIRDDHVRGTRPLPTPLELITEIPVPQEAAERVIASRATIARLLSDADPRTMVIVGPCSVDDPGAALEYGRRLASLSSEVEDVLFIAMRVYFEKPRTTVGWKGLINDPSFDSTGDVASGLRIARRLLVDILDLGLPTATEFLEPVIPQYLGKLCKRVSDRAIFGLVANKPGFRAEAG